MITATDRLDRFWAYELGCAPDALYQGGISICTPPHRQEPRWMGWLVPVECVAIDAAGAGTGVISIVPEMAGHLQRSITPATPAAACLPPQGQSLSSFMRERFPAATPKIHRILSCMPTQFRPADDVFAVEMMPDDDIQVSWYRLHFDGPIFVIRNEYGSIISWAALKWKSDEVWEMAVATESAYRNRGLARSVVTHATRYTFDHGKIALYLHEISNMASAHVCGALGYQPYGYELTCENGRVAPKRR